MMSEAEMIQLGFVIRHSVVGTPISDVLPQFGPLGGRTGAMTRLPERQNASPQLPGISPVAPRMPRGD
jgi:hypothetical protein